MDFHGTRQATQAGRQAGYGSMANETATSSYVS